MKNTDQPDPTRNPIDLIQTRPDPPVLPCLEATFHFSFLFWPKAKQYIQHKIQVYMQFYFFFTKFPHLGPQRIKKKN